MEHKAQISQTDSTLQNADSTRREAVKLMGAAGARLAAIALPFSLLALTEPAQAQLTTTAAINALRFALRLEYFMAAYYRKGLAVHNIPTAERSVLSSMLTNLTNHASFLDKTLVRGTVIKPADSSYDITGGGVFNGVLQNYQTFLAVAQVLEDTAVRAYKGLMLSFAGQQVYITAGLSLHSVRARHAATLRYIRSSVYGVNIKPWVSGSAAVANDSSVAGADAFYEGESNIQQLNMAITGSATVATEAFDEPLTMAEAEALLARFKV